MKRETMKKIKKLLLVTTIVFCVQACANPDRDFENNKANSSMDDSVTIRQDMGIRDSMPEDSIYRSNKDTSGINPNVD